MTNYTATYPRPGERPSPMLWFLTGGKNAPTVEVVSADWVAHYEFAYTSRDGTTVYNLSRVEVNEGAK